MSDMKGIWYGKKLDWKIRCRKCRDVIQSKHRHDMVWCKCGAIAVDGGSDYTKISGDPINWEILPIIKERTDDESKM